MRPAERTARALAVLALVYSLKDNRTEPSRCRRGALDRGEHAAHAPRELALDPRHAPLDPGDFRLRHERAFDLVEGSQVPVLSSGAPL